MVGAKGLRWKVKRDRMEDRFNGSGRGDVYPSYHARSTHCVLSTPLVSR